MQSLQISSRLLAVEQRKGTVDEGRIRTFPAALALFNLTLCAYMDQFLRADSNGHYLALFLFLECSMLVLMAIGTFMRNDLEILVKTSVFPMTSMGVLLFVLFTFLRKPPAVSLWLTSTLFLIVMY